MDTDLESTMSDPHEGFDFVCTVCEGGNGGQICETCSGHVEGFKRWLVATETLPKAFTRFIIVHKNLRSTYPSLPSKTLYYPDREAAQERFTAMGDDAEFYEIREVAVALKD